MYGITKQDDLCSKNLTFFSCGLMTLSDCGGAHQRFATLPFRMAPEDFDTETETDDSVPPEDFDTEIETEDSVPPEDFDTEIETDDSVRDMSTLWRTMNDLKRQVQEQEQTLRKQTEMLREKDETLQEREQTIQMLLARQGRFEE
jgi:hypothetical protein